MLLTITNKQTDIRRVSQNLHNFVGRGNLVRMRAIFLVRSAHVNSLLYIVSEVDTCKPEARLGQAYTRAGY